MKSKKKLIIIPSIRRRRIVKTASGLFINWRVIGVSVLRYSFRRASAINGFLLAFFLHIISRLGRGVEFKGVLVAVPHDKVSRTQQVFYRTAIAAFGDVQGFVNSGEAEDKFEIILIAAQVEIEAEGNARKCFESFLPFVNGDLYEVAIVLEFVNNDGFLI